MALAEEIEEQFRTSAEQLGKALSLICLRWKEHSVSISSSYTHRGSIFPASWSRRRRCCASGRRLEISAQYSAE